MRIKHDEFFSFDGGLFDIILSRAAARRLFG